MRYEDDTVLMADSEKKLQNLDRVVEDGEQKRINHQVKDDRNMVISKRKAEDANWRYKHQTDAEV